jgi:hypothetical protein
MAAKMNYADVSAPGVRFGDVITLFDEGHHGFLTSKGYAVLTHSAILFFLFNALVLL